MVSAISPFYSPNLNVVGLSEPRDFLYKKYSSSYLKPLMQPMQKKLSSGCNIMHLHRFFAVGIAVNFG